MVFLGSTAVPGPDRTGPIRPRIVIEDMDMESFAVPGPDRTGPIRRSNISAKRIPVADTTLTHCCHYRETESQRRDFPRYTLLELVLITLISLSTWRGWSILGAIVVSILATLLSVFEVIRLGAEAIRLGAKTIAIGAEIALVYMESELSAAKVYRSTRCHSSTQYTPHVDQDEAPLPPPTPPLMPSGQQLVGQTLDILSDQPRFSTSLPPEAPLPPLPTSSPPLLQTPHIHTDAIQQDPVIKTSHSRDIEHDHEEIIEKKIMFEQSKSLESESPEPSRLPPLAHPIPAIVLKLSSTRALPIPTQLISVRSVGIQHRRPPTTKIRHFKKKRKRKK